MRSSTYCKDATTLCKGFVLSEYEAPPNRLSHDEVNSKTMEDTTKEGLKPMTEVGIGRG